MKKWISGIIALAIFQLVAIVSFSQTNGGDAVLFTVGGTPVTKSEFVYIYTKNNLNKKNDFSQESLEEYLDLYINYKLKVKEAEAEQIDTMLSVRTELDKYGDQLIKSNFDKEVLDVEVQKIYKRMETERLIYHIMSAFPANPTPADTLKSYQIIKDAQARLNKGEDFSKVASELTSDVNGRTNGGRVGWITGFSIPDMNFEDAAYNTKVGGISPIIRSKYGYHILNVKEERPSSGEIKVEHLLMRIKANATAKDSAMVKAKIDSIAAVIKSGEVTFEDMVQQYSDDTNTKTKNGELDWFGVGKMTAPFEDAAFSIKNVGDVSPPVLTSFGWHLIKLIDKRGLAPYEDMQADIKSRIERTAQYRDIRSNYIAMVKKDNNFIEFPENKKAVLAMLDTSFLSGTWKPVKLSAMTQPVFTIGTLVYTQAELASYLELKQKTLKDNDIETKFNKIYNIAEENVLIEYQLGKEDPDFKRLMQEYRAGIPLFELTNQKVWLAAAKDSVGLEAYYEQHKNEYMWDERVDATIYECNNDSIATAVRKMLKKKKSDDDIIAAFNTDSTSQVIIENNLFLAGQDSNVDQMNKKIGIGENVLNSDGSITFVKVIKVVPPTPKTLKEARGYVISGYQDELEKTWLANLRTKYPVQVNQEVFNSLIK